MAEGEQPKKKRKKPKAPGAGAGAAKAKAEPKPGAPAKPKAKTEPKPDAPAKPEKGEARGWGRWFWVGLVVVGSIELFIYGYRGDLEVCVGRAGVTDFALQGQPRTEESRGKHPECHRARNIGLRSGYDDAVQESAILACKRATLFQGQDVLLQCAAGLAPFEHRVEARFVWPWEPDYYRRLFWFLFSGD